jgi:phenylacetate-CoA oxygenase PaaJ subunit
MTNVAHQQSRLKDLIARGKDQGYLTYSEVNDHLPEDISDPDQVEDIIQMINDMGIQVFEVAPDADELLMAEGDSAADDIAAALQDAGLPGRVVTQLSPAWTTDWMTEAAKDKLRAYGIAPPSGGHAPAAAGGVMQFSRHATRTADVACPQCGSHNTTQTSPFGSTACKALYRCLDCLEPFDYFKTI